MGSGRKKYGESNGMRGSAIGFVLGEIIGWSLDPNWHEIKMRQGNGKNGPDRGGKTVEVVQKIKADPMVPMA